MDKNKLEKNLKQAEHLIKKADENRLKMYGIVDGLKALYYQNKAMIELLKNYTQKKK